MKNIYKRNHNYYYRKNIPQYLKIVFGNRVLYIRSLQTKNKIIGLRYVKLLNRKFEHIKESYLMGLDLELIKNLINELHNTYLNEIEEDLYNVPNSEDELFSLELDDNIKQLQLNYHSNDFNSVYNDIDVISQKLPNPLTKHNIETIGKQLLSTQINNLKLIREKVNNGDYNKPKPTFINTVDTLQEQNTLIPNKSIEPKETKPIETFKSISERYINFQSKEDDWSIDTKQMNIRTLKLLDMYFKNQDIKLITYQNLLEFRDVLFEIPSRFQGMNIFKNKDLDYILNNSDDMDRLSNNSINKYQVRVNQICKFLFNIEIMSRPFKFKKLDESLNDGREHYEDDEVIKIQDLLSKDTKENYFITLLAIFQGMRLKEITQLSKDDIIIKNNINCISINRSEDKTTKNKNSIRLVPLHSKLIELGFLDYISKKQKNLFKINNKDFSSYFRKTYKNQINENKTFYCLRHSFITKLVEDSQSIEHIAMLVGHTQQYKITFGYTHKIPLKALDKVINTIKY